MTLPVDLPTRDRLASEATEEIEVTDAMIEAGYEASRLYDRDDPKDWEIAAVYRAMEKARRRYKVPFPTPRDSQSEDRLG
jgi:hypothetical protein